MPLIVWSQGIKTNKMFVNYRCHQQQQSQNLEKSQKTYILTLPHHQGQVMSVKCEQHLDLLQSKLVYCMTTQTLNIALYMLGWRNCRQTNQQKNKQIDGRMLHCITLKYYTQFKRDKSTGIQKDNPTAKIVIKVLYSTFVYVSFWNFVKSTFNQWGLVWHRKFSEFWNAANKVHHNG